MEKLIGLVAIADLPEVLFAGGEKRPRMSSERGSRNALLERWAESDVHAAMALRGKSDRRSEAAGGRHCCPGQMGGPGWGERRGMGEAIARGPLRDEALQTVISSLSEKDSRRALALLQKFGKRPSERFQDGDFDFRRPCEERRASRVNQALQLPPGRFRVEALQGAASSWAQTTPQSTVIEGRAHCRRALRNSKSWPQRDSRPG